MAPGEALGLGTALLRSGAVAPAAAAGAETEQHLVVQGLSVRYGDRPFVFSNINLAIKRGEQVALIGANGVGKSTLLKCCLGFVKPAAGGIHLLGQCLDRVSLPGRRRLRSDIGFVAQKHNLVQRLSVLSNVVHGMLATRPGPRYWIHSLAAKPVRRRALDVLDQVGLADLAPRRADSLSGGQSQRVAIARALMAEPSLILADEPAASLDPAAGEEVMTTFEKVSRDTGATLVFTTHNLEHALRYGKRVLGLRGGGLELDAPSAGLLVTRLRGLYG